MPAASATSWASSSITRASIKEARKAPEHAEVRPVRDADPHPARIRPADLGRLHARLRSRHASTAIRATLDFALRNRFTFAAFNILMPYPNTPLYDRLDRKGRHLYDGKWWLHPRLPLQRRRLRARAHDARRADRGLLRGAQGVQPHSVAALALLRPQDQHAHAHAHGAPSGASTRCSGARCSRSTACCSAISALMTMRRALRHSTNMSPRRC